MAGATVLVVGESLVDITSRPSGETSAPGGSPLNVAVGLARLGVTTTLATQLGDDDAGELVRDHLDASDVDVRSLPPHHGDTSVALARLDGRGQATYEFELVWNPSELPTPDGFSLLHVGSIGATLEPGADSVAELVRDAQRKHVPVSLDPNVRAAITPDLDRVRARVLDLAACASVVKVSDEDAAVLWPGLDESAVHDLLVGDGPIALFAMTRGGDDVVLRSGSRAVRVPTPRVEVADTIGAGDSFMAALLAALVERGWVDRDGFDTDELTELGTYAARAAGVTVSRPGADPPWRTELDAT